MRGAWSVQGAPVMALALGLLVLPALGGCLSFLNDKEPAPKPSDPADVGYDPSTIRITSVVREEFIVPSFDGINIAAVAYVPKSPDLLADGTVPTWPVLLVLHGWSRTKEFFEGNPQNLPAQPPAETPEGTPVAGVNWLEQLAQGGIIAVAYDFRGWGDSGGVTTLAGPAEIADVDAVLDAVDGRYATSGLVGMTGHSLGAGTSLLAMTLNPRIDTVAQMTGWSDLYGSYIPGNVPKLEWGNIIIGAGSAKGRLHPDIYDWHRASTSRQGMETVEAAFDLRSSRDALPTNTKPIFTCQALQDTSWTDHDWVWQESAGFSRAYYYTGGHLDVSPCYDRVTKWMRHFIGGYDEGIADWPALSTVDAGGGRETEYVDFPEPVFQKTYLRMQGLDPQPSNATFTVEQRLLSNPFNEPSYVWDYTEMPNNAIPEQFRQDPTAHFFETELTEAKVLLGAAEVKLVLAEGEQAPFQVTGILFKVDGTGKSLILSRGAYAALDETDIDNGTVPLRFHWTKANLAPGDTIVLRLGANDESWFMPYPGNYATTFTGASSLSMPFFEG